MTEEAGKVLYLDRLKRFTLEEARAMLPRIRELTERYMKDASPLIHDLQAPLLDSLERERLSKELQGKLDEWATEIGRLGVLAKGLWLIDFDSGSGYYCWRYNEPDVLFFHGYEEGFSGRTPIQ